MGMPVATIGEPSACSLHLNVWRSSDRRLVRPTIVERPELLAWLAASAAARGTRAADRRLLEALSELAWSAGTVPLLECLVGRSLARDLAIDLGAGMRGMAATSWLGCDIVRGGVVDLCFDRDWTPTTTESTRHETLAFVWPTFWDDMARTLDVGLDFSALALCVGDWDVWDEAGDFWTDGAGPAGKVVLYALRLIATYIDHLSNDAPECPGARSAMTANLFRADWMDVDRWAGLGDDEATCSFEHGLPVRFDGAELIATGKTNLVTRQVHLGANFVEQMGRAVDRLLWQAHRARQYAVAGRAPGGLVGAIYYLQQARWLGSMALGGVATIANTIIHETMHAEVTWYHCNPGRNNCCQERMAAIWQCRTMARTGALRCDYDDDDPIDLMIGGLVAGGSACRNKASYADICAGDVAEAKGNLFCWVARLDRPGEPADRDAWSKHGDWVSPAGCA